MRSKMVKLLPTVAQQSQQSGESLEIWNDKEIKPNEKTISQVLLSQNNYYSKTRFHGPSWILTSLWGPRASRWVCLNTEKTTHYFQLATSTESLFLTISSTHTLLIQKYFSSTGFRRKFAAEFFGRKFEFGAKPFRRKKSTEAISRETSTGRTLLRIRTEYGP